MDGLGLLGDVSILEDLLILLVGRHYWLIQYNMHSIDVGGEAEVQSRASAMTLAIAGAKGGGVPLWWGYSDEAPELQLKLDRAAWGEAGQRESRTR